ncbi:MAG: hypothetical protein M1815_005216 [Lichina confinis]|nr:MAG: hypothetical protein M1815_005216 [Lichina confinis]
MPPATVDDQFKFLISCIRHANNGKVDFSAVAKECGVVSKGAAAKRYERMMRAHGISTPGPSGRPVPGSSPTKGEDASPAKKRKFDKGKDAVFADVAHDDEGMAGIKSEGTNEDSAFHTNTDQDSSPTAQKRVKPADLADEEDLGSDLDCLRD